MTRRSRSLPWPAKDSPGPEGLLTHEWLVTNGLGGYASSTVSGVITRGFHGYLIAALASPFGRMMMLNDVLEEVEISRGKVVQLGALERVGMPLRLQGADYLREFRLDMGLPVWHYELEGISLEKRLLMPHGQNSVYIRYQILEGDRSILLRLRPSIHFRPYGAPVNTTLESSYVLTVVEDRYEVAAGNGLPPVRFLTYGPAAALTVDRVRIQEVIYRLEENRGYPARGDLWSPGFFHSELKKGTPFTLVASTESWDTVRALSPQQALGAECDRRERLLLEAKAGRPNLVESDTTLEELVLAADQFIITPAGRTEDATRAQAAGDEVRTVIAGYHWFTDWGRDTMISMEGLTLKTGRWAEAAWILRTFAHYIREGLIPNLFPEGQREGLYHTADATLWFFHALDRYLEASKDRSLLQALLPKLMDIVEHHLRGTRFGIGVDPDDGLLRQGQEHYQLTWMDAKVDDWVVTPRRGKAVEINSLWYNALRLLESWLRERGREEAAVQIFRHSERARSSFNRRFWYEPGNHLYDVVDGPGGDDPACRPNQIFAISLKHPILDESRWRPVVEVVQTKLLTPVGLRSLSPDHRDYKAKYDGDLRSRDAAYHQGTVWAWLIGPFVDAWLKVHASNGQEARTFLQGFVPHLSEACVGSISEIFDAEAPFTPRGCVAQAWSVAEVLRCWVNTAA
jgi:predicted glycogen debranching enzyme